MNVISTRKVEDCFDGSRVFEVVLDEESSESFVQHMGGLGRLEYFRDFSRPFYRVTRDGEFMINGVEGSRSFQVVFFTSPERGLTMVESHVTGSARTGG